MLERRASEKNKVIRMKAGKEERMEKIEKGKTAGFWMKKEEEVDVLRTPLLLIQN